MKNIIIIGANGFTGRQILNDLSSKAQYKVTGCSLHPDILPKNGGFYAMGDLLSMVLSVRCQGCVPDQIDL